MNIGSVQYDIAVYLSIDFSDGTVSIASYSCDSCANCVGLEDTLITAASNVAEEISELYDKTVTSVKFIPRSEYDETLNTVTRSAINTIQITCDEHGNISTINTLNKNEEEGYYMDNIDLKFLQSIKNCVSSATDYNESTPTLPIRCTLRNTIANVKGKTYGHGRCVHEFESPRDSWVNNELTPQQKRTCHTECEHCIVDKHLTLEPVLFKDNGYNKITMLQEDVNLTLNAKRYIKWLIDKLESAERYIEQLTTVNLPTESKVNIPPPRTLCQQVEPSDIEYGEVDEEGEKDVTC